MSNARAGRRVWHPFLLETKSTCGSHLSLCSLCILGESLCLVVTRVTAGADMTAHGHMRQRREHDTGRRRLTIIEYSFLLRHGLHVDVFVASRLEVRMVHRRTARAGQARAQEIDAW